MLELADEPRKIDVWEAGAGVINNGHCHGFGAAVVIVWAGVCATATECALLEFGIDGTSDLKKYEGCKEAAEGASLGKAFLLAQGVEGELGSSVPDGVVVVVEKVKEWDKGGEMLLLQEFVSSGMSGDGVEHVFDV